jgi:hypothetical protein
MATQLNASLISNSDISSKESPARFRARGMTREGDMGKSFGAVSASA